MDRLKKLNYVNSVRSEMRQAEKDAAASLAASGKLTGRQRLAKLFDEGTFAELGAFVSRKYGADGTSADTFEGVITGYGAVDGKLVYAFAQDFSKVSGALGSAHAAKITAIYDLAAKNGAPVVGVFDSAGLDIPEGLDALAGYSAVLRKAASLSGVVPQVYAVCGVCSGGAALIAASGDVVVIEETNGKLFVNSPFLLKGLDGAPSDTGSADSALRGGLAALGAKGEDNVFALVKQVISFLPSNSLEGLSVTPTTDDSDRLTFNVRSHVLSDDYNIKSIITDAADNGVFLELYASFGPSLVCGFAAIGGINVGVVANQPAVDAGAITDRAARKAARFISMCDAFSLPIVTLVDTCGLAFSFEAEQAPLAAEAGKLVFAYASATAPKVTLVCGKAYGTGFAVMGSKALGADLALALPCAEISVLPPETAVDILYGDTITSPQNREELVERWAGITSSPVEAAKGGHIDDIIELPEVRQRIASALQMLSGKRESVLPKKHGNLPI